MNAFPAFIPLYQARVVVVGDGEAAEAKARLFADIPGELVRVPAARALDAPAYEGARLAFIAVEDEATAEQAAALARAAGALVNVVDRQWLGDFHTPAIVDRSPVVAAIGTGGAAPVLATLLRNRIEARWPEGLGRVAALSGELQRTVRERIPDGAARRAWWRRFLNGPAAEAAEAGDMDEARRLALALIDTPHLGGKALFLRAPPQADLLTLAAARAFAGADRVVAGAEVTEEVIAFTRRDARRHASATPAEIAAWVEEGETVLVVDLDLMDAVAALGATVRRLPAAH